MKHIEAGKAKLVIAGGWLAEDPRRLTVIFTLVMALATMIALSAGLTHPGVLVGPNSDGGSGGG